MQNIHADVPDRFHIIHGGDPRVIVIGRRAILMGWMHDIWSAEQLIALSLNVPSVKLVGFEDEGQWIQLREDQ